MDARVTEMIERIKGFSPVTESFVGVDIGTSSIKIVQLSVTDNVVTLETYGEISNAPYDVGETSGKASASTPLLRSAGLSDLLHEVDARSRQCGVAVPLSESFINILDLPKRDPEQMRRIIPTEIQKFIPIAVDKLMLDWYPLFEDEVSVFDEIIPSKKTEAHFQKVVVVAVNTDSASRLSQTVVASHLTPSFFEIEMFSAARACIYQTEVPSLILDLGASATKAYLLNEHKIPVDARVIPAGGNALTEAVMKSLLSNTLTAERAKCEQGLADGSEVRVAIESALAPIETYTQQMFADHKERGGKPVERVFLIGGGSYIPGIVDLLSKKLSLPVELIRAFDRTKGPMIMEAALREDGPRYAVAVGLALRGIGR